MDDILRKRLSEQELELYDRFDGRAGIAGHFVVWPAIAGAISYSGSRYLPAMICLVIVLIAFPVLLIMGKKAKRLRELAENRYAGIMGHKTYDSARQQTDRKRRPTNEPY